MKIEGMVAYVVELEGAREVAIVDVPRMPRFIQILHDRPLEQNNNNNNIYIYIYRYVYININRYSPAIMKDVMSTMLNPLVSLKGVFSDSPSDVAANAFKKQRYKLTAFKFI